MATILLLCACAQYVGDDAVWILRSDTLMLFWAREWGFGSLNCQSSMVCMHDLSHSETFSPPVVFLPSMSQVADPGSVMFSFKRAGQVWSRVKKIIAGVGVAIPLAVMAGNDGTAYDARQQSGAALLP